MVPAIDTVLMESEAHPDSGYWFLVTFSENFLVETFSSRETIYVVSRKF